MPTAKTLPDTLDADLRAQAGEAELARALSATLHALAQAAVPIAERIALGPLAGEHGRVHAERGGGDKATELDVLAHQHFIDALRAAPVAAVLSEEDETPLTLDPRAPLMVALDPLDGSSNIDTNVSIGTIFSILPQVEGGPEVSFLQPGRAQLAAGFFIYGPQTSLALTLGAGTSLYVLERRAGPTQNQFRVVARNVRVPTRTQEFAINASNQRHWDSTIRAYVDDCIRGEEGPRREDCNMRWIASLVAETWRILVRGGIYLYPGDARAGYRQGRLRLVYEANPIALLMEQAGGAATDGVERILDLVPGSAHQRSPLVFGSASEVARVARYVQGLGHDAERSPLFRPRGLLRA